MGGTWDCTLIHRDGDLKTIVGATSEAAVAKATAFATAHPGTYVAMLPPTQTGSRPYPSNAGRVVVEHMKAERERCGRELDGWLPDGERKPDGYVVIQWPESVKAEKGSGTP